MKLNAGYRCPFCKQLQKKPCYHFCTPMPAVVPAWDHKLKQISTQQTDPKGQKEN